MTKDKPTPEQEVQKQALVAYLRKAADHLDALVEKMEREGRGEIVAADDFDA